MSLDRLAQLGEFIGGVAVLITLVYLAFQLRQNTRAVRATNHQAQMDAHARYLMGIAGDPVLSRIFKKLWIEDGFRSLDEEEADRFPPILHAAFGQFETAFRSFREGLIVGAWWDKQAAALDVWLTAPDVQVWWREQGGIFPADFSGYVESRLSRLKKGE